MQALGRGKGETRDGRGKGRKAKRREGRGEGREIGRKEGKKGVLEEGRQRQWVATRPKS